MKSLTASQLDRLTVLFHLGASVASEALSKWLESKALVEIDALKQLSLEEASALLGAADLPWCACVMGVEGSLTGKLLFCFDDASGLQLAQYLTGESPASAPAIEPAQWSELQRSAALETANIVGSAYVSSLANMMSLVSLMPTPPQFVRDFAASLIESAVMDQMVALDQVLFARTQFHIDDSPIQWSLLLVPDPDSLQALAQWLDRPPVATQVKS
jgi:chemotaxis protein CheC